MHHVRQDEALGALRQFVAIVGLSQILDNQAVSDIHLPLQTISCDSQCEYRNDGSSDDIQGISVNPTPPFASSIGHFNVSLRWHAANISGTTYIVQWKYVHIPAQWEYTQTVVEPSYTVDNLQPYTEYWFRVTWIICQLQFYSPPSPAYRTLAFGAPAEAPIIDTLDSSSGDTIEVRWFPPLFPNGPIVGYNLKLSSDNENQRHHSVTGKQSFQFYATKPQTTYRFSITAVNVQGEGPAAEANITTEGSAVPDNSLWLFLSRSNVLKKRENLKDIVNEAQCLPVLSRITGVSIDIYMQDVYFSEQNHIWVKGAKNMTNTSDLRKLYSGHETITSISVDWLYNKIYFVMGKQIYFCSLINCTAAERIILPSDPSPTKIIADPYNGLGGSVELPLLLSSRLKKPVPRLWGAAPDPHCLTGQEGQNTPRTSLGDCDNGCQQKRLGRHLETGNSPGNLVITGSSATYQPIGGPSSVEDIKTAPTSLERKTNTHLIRQHNYSKLYLKSGRHTEFSSKPDGPSVLFLGRTPSTSDHSNLASRDPELSSRLPPQKQARSGRMVPKEKCLSRHNSNSGIASSRSCGYNRKHKVQQIPILLEEPTSSGAGCQRYRYAFLLLDDGIHRIILPEVSIKDNLPMHIVNRSGIQDFMVNVKSKRLVYVTNKEQRFLSIISVFLDGSDTRMVRQIDDADFFEIRSFLYYRDNLMFTDGRAVYYEDFFMNKYWYNEYIVTCDLAAPPSSDFNNLIFYGDSVQPFPLPSQPQKVMVLFGTQSATIQWKPPKSPLESNEEDPFIIAVGVDGIWRQPLEKFGPGKFISDKFKLISDLDWYNGTLYWSNETGYVHMWEMRDTSGLSASHISGIRRAGPLAFDWLGQYIYWSDKIYRKPLVMQGIETVTTAPYLVKDLSVDPINAFLYWSTDYTVESSRLNGQNKLIFQNLTLFSSTQVAALTLDLRFGHLYWLVMDGLKINMYRAILCKDGSTETRITEFASWSSSEISQHALMFYSDRFFWINGQKYITVQEVSQSECTPFSQPAEFMAFTLILESLKPLPGNFSSTPIVIPDSIPSSAFKIRGNYSSFTIFWKEPLNVEYGTVFYCVESNKLHQLSGKVNPPCLTSEDYSDPFYTVEGLEPYAEFDFAVTPYTYWGRGLTTALTLRTPEGVPSAPLNPRMFLLQNISVFDKRTIGVEMRWDAPDMPNGALIKFTVSYRIINETLFDKSLATWTTIDTAASARSFQLNNLTYGYLLQFQVKAYTSVGSGPFSETAMANLSDVRPTPALISISSRLMNFIDMDRKEEIWNLSVEKDLKAVSYTANDGKLYYILNDLLFCRHLENNSTVLLLMDKRLSDCHSMTADWIARHIYVSIHSEHNSDQVLVIDLEQKNKVLRLISSPYILVNFTIETISVYSLLSRLYWIESWNTGKRIAYYNVKNDSVNYVLGLNKTGAVRTSVCSCFVKHSEIGSPMALDSTDINNPYIYFLRNDTEIWASDLEGCHCWKVLSISLLPEGTTVSSLAVDDFFIYWSINANENTSIYQANKNINLTALLQIKGEHTQVVAYSKSLQPFPDISCLVLASSESQPRILNITNTSITLELPPADTQKICPLIVSTTPTYRVRYRRLTDGGNTVSNCSVDSACKSMELQEQIILIPSLQPFSTYEMEVWVENYYSFLLAQQPAVKMVTAKTEYGVPGAVDYIMANVLSDSLIKLTWSEPSQPNGPLELIRYQITVNILPPSPISPWRRSKFPEEQLTWTFTSLYGGTNYEFKVLTFHPDENWFSESATIYATTFKTPSAPENIVSGNTSLYLEWKAPKETFKDFWFELKEVQKRDWFLPINTSCTNGSLCLCTLTGVVPNMDYYVQAVVIFMTEVKSISPPASFKTSAGVPGKPGVPQVLPGDENTIQWETAEDHGSDLVYNILEYRNVPADGRRELTTWKVAFNDSCNNICIWKSKTLDGTFQFRAVAANMLGLGAYSKISETIILVKVRTSSDKDVGIIVASILATVFIVILVTAFVMYQKFKRKPKKWNEKISVIQEDKELAALRGLSNTVGLANACCYAVSTLPTQNEMEKLPSFSREKLTLCVFLGSGAFGEVYEGIAEDIMGPETGSIKVAVKTLRKDATDHEKAEFLKEAHLMSQFDHPNILKLLGVCLFNEPQYIILELMDGGDLLTYLRGARANSLVLSPLLSNLDLLNISENISRGCTYLERMHFVHRDLAARNCLVSVKEYNNPERTVKIGDFGLARDVYKYDYYRKKGEGLLPVRWMAPESLIDGIFSSSTDVWSFGVLLWEIFTLGQQPYQGYSNLEVLHHVQSGQRMESPMNCPDDLWSLILKCWAKDPLKRPTFSYLQRQLEELKGCSLRCTHFKGKSTDLEGVINPAFEDSGGSVISTVVDGTGSMTLTETRNAEGLNYLMVSISMSKEEKTAGDENITPRQA
ncbi:proto-oncogene tyrosine-protein kinase ROS [Rhinophrynus dorsalis]